MKGRGGGGRPNAEKKLCKANGFEKKIPVKVFIIAQSRETQSAVLYIYVHKYMGHQGGAVARTLASHQCDLGLIPGLGSM